MRTIPEVREKAMSAMQSVSWENCFVGHVVAFAAVEGILSSAVPSAPFQEAWAWFQHSHSPMKSSPASEVFLPMLFALYM